MIRTFYLVASLSLISFVAQGQTENARTHALIQSATQEKGQQDPNFAVFRTMESVRHGMLPGYKGVEVRVEQPVCDGQQGAIYLVNPSGEPWKYKVIDKSGPMVTEGQVGYNRHISSLNTGTYLIQFILADGTSVIDEFSIRKGKGLQASVRQVDKPSGNTVKLKCEAPGANEFTWDFGDGTTAYGGAEMEHKYKTSGNYMVKVSANNFDCKAEASMPLEISTAVAAELKGE